MGYMSHRNVLNMFFSLNGIWKNLRKLWANVNVSFRCPSRQPLFTNIPSFHQISRLSVFFLANVCTDSSKYWIFITDGHGSQISIVDIEFLQAILFAEKFNQNAYADIPGSFIFICISLSIHFVEL